MRRRSISARRKPTPQSSGGSNLPPTDNLLLNVNITIVSLAGIQVKESSKNGKKITAQTNPKKQENDLAKTSTSSPKPSEKSPLTTVVASFSRNVTSSQKTILTHIPSAPLQLSPAGSSKPFKKVVYWPDEDGCLESISSFQFQRYFLCEEQGANKKQNRKKRRFVPQSCSILLAISRNGKMFKLGKADVLISGDENGESSINVPIVSHYCTNGKSSSKKTNTEVQLMRLKGDTLKCGVDPNATLRVLINVTDPAHANENSTISPTISSNHNQVDVTKCRSEASWEYDPQKAAVVMKKRDSVVGRMPSVEGMLVNTTTEVSPAGEKGSPPRQPLGSEVLEEMRKQSQAPRVSPLVPPKHVGNRVRTPPEAYNNDEMSFWSASTSSSDDCSSSQSHQASQHSQTGIEILPFLRTAAGSTQDKFMVCSSGLPESAHACTQNLKRCNDLASNQTKIIPCTDNATVMTSSTASSSNASSKKAGDELSPNKKGKSLGSGKHFIFGFPLCGAYNHKMVLSCVHDEEMSYVGCQEAGARGSSYAEEENSLVGSLSDSDSEF